MTIRPFEGYLIVNNRLKPSLPIGWGVEALSLMYSLAWTALMVPTPSSPETIRLEHAHYQIDVINLLYNDSKTHLYESLTKGVIVCLQQFQLL